MPALLESVGGQGERGRERSYVTLKFPHQVICGRTPMLPRKCCGTLSTEWVGTLTSTSAQRMAKTGRGLVTLSCIVLSHTSFNQLLALWSLPNFVAERAVDYTQIGSYWCWLITIGKQFIGCVQPRLIISVNTHVNSYTALSHIVF